MSKPCSLTLRADRLCSMSYCPRKLRSVIQVGALLQAWLTWLIPPRLEIEQSRNAFVGSNPTPSATYANSEKSDARPLPTHCPDGGERHRGAKASS
jgi:hypothetical protein